MAVKLDTTNKILIDWLSFTSTNFSCNDDVIKFLGLTSLKWEDGNGFYGFRSRLYSNSISIHYGHKIENLICVEMSGSGCRAFETYNDLVSDTFVEIPIFEYIFSNIIKYPEKFRITRLDIAYDDFQKILDINQIQKDILQKNYISKCDSFEVIISNKGKSLTIGSKKSDLLIRIYDKAAERNITDGTSWIRCEMQLRNERAEKFIYYFLKDDNIGKIYRGVLINYLRFVTPSKTDINKCRWQLRPYWKKFIDNVEKIKLYSKPGIIYNLDHIRDYILSQPKNSIAAYIEAVGGDEFMNLILSSDYKLNKKQRSAVNDYISGQAFEQMIKEIPDIEVKEDVYSKFRNDKN